MKAVVSGAVRLRERPSRELLLYSFLALANDEFQFIVFLKFSTTDTTAMKKCDCIQNEFGYGHFTFLLMVEITDLISRSSTYRAALEILISNRQWWCNAKRPVCTV